jgi:hypothetical protein
MANSSVTLTSIDFDTLKQNFKTYLSTQSVFKDYNFEGSNINVLLDVMSYNTYLNAFYLNMVASEMFLDSAQKLDSIVSHAKELNYVRRSAASSVANISFTASTTGITPPLTIPEGTLFSGTNSNGTFNFVTRNDNTYTSPNTVYSVDNLQIFEGFYVNNSFIVNYNNEAQRYVLTNENIDLNSLVVTVYENNQQDWADYLRVDTLFGLSNTSNVYFIQACEKDQYEILFGDGFLGYKPQNEALVVAKYLVTVGEEADGISEFSINTDLGIHNGGTVTVSALSVVSNSASGANAETIESIRFNAPRYFATQQRAVATDDYRSLIMSKFGGVISDVNVYGGQNLEPKQYGRVAICIKPSESTIAPDFVKNQVTSYLQDYISVPSRMIITDPDYFYCKIICTVQYNKTITTKNASQIKSIVLNSIQEFSTEHLEQFTNDFRYSKFVSHIDESDESITSNNTDVKLVKKLYPKINTAQSHTINFNNKVHSNDHGHAVLESSYFTYIDENFVYYTLCYLKDDSNGNIIVYTYINGIYTVLNSSVGTIDYETGTVILSSLKVADYGDSFNICLYTLDKDFYIDQSQVLLIDLSDVTLNVVEENR